MVHSYVCHGTFMCVPWLNHVCAMIHSCVLLYLQRKRMCCSVLWCVAVSCGMLRCVAVCCSMLQYVAVCCSVLQCAAVCRSALQRKIVLLICVPWLTHMCAMMHSYVCRNTFRYKPNTVCTARHMVQCVAVCCSVLQFVAGCSEHHVHSKAHDRLQVVPKKWALYYTYSHFRKMKRRIQVSPGTEPYITRIHYSERWNIVYKLYWKTRPIFTTVHILERYIVVYRFRRKQRPILHLCTF